MLGFLQGIVTNDVRPLEQGIGLVYTVFLTPKGKYMHDAMIHAAQDSSVLLDVHADSKQRLLQWLIR